ncbi:hypothetical protein PVK06_007366 [Gossypium arboreum]|uniref:Uncharacterized protein n=1 Tax=Gossypium arboreum TaxID=29729 RepID=A0ABR0QH41_GOSAR|nr:hypothetical protein PVK06_007366 [Gossypium arboreum]
MGGSLSFKTLFGTLIVLGFIIVGTLQQEGQVKDLGKGKSTLVHQRLDLNYMSKRRVPNGPDPIHNSVRCSITKQSKSIKLKADHATMKFPCFHQIAASWQLETTAKTSLGIKVWGSFESAEVQKDDDHKASISGIYLAFIVQWVILGEREE